MCKETLDWIKVYGSGSLRRAVEEDMAWFSMYLGERVALEIGYGFEAISASRVTIGKALASSDDSATTETCWWARALRYRADRDNRAASILVRYITVTEDDSKREGIGIQYLPFKELPWLPKDKLLIAFTTDKNGTVNPC